MDMARPEPTDTVAYTTANEAGSSRPDLGRAAENAAAAVDVEGHRQSPRESAPIVSRRYPLDLPDGETSPNLEGRRGWLDDRGFAMKLAGATAEILLDLGDWRRRHADLSQALLAVLLLVAGLLLGGSAAVTDSYLHRGVESGAEQPYIVQPTGKGLAANLDLRSYTADGVANIANAMEEAGFRHVRQEFSWSQIEATRGAYDWGPYDLIVNEMSRLGIDVIAVIVDTPDWARAAGATGFANAPPRDPALLTAFATELTGRYPDSAPFIQVWDRPNLADNWGGQPASGADFAPYLEAAWRGAKAGSPQSGLVTPELAVAPAGAGARNDLAFIQELYDANAQPYFDLLGMTLDGGTISPDDRRVDPDRFNFSRAILVRELMLDNGDAATPVWATSFGWAASGSVDPDEQAEFVERGMSRSWSEWPWMGLMVQWAFIAPADSARAPYAIVDANGSPTPLYSRLTAGDMQARATIAHTGFAPMDAQSISDSGNWEDQPLEGRSFRTTRQVGASTTIEFEGTGLIAYVRSGPEVGTFTIEVDGDIVSGGGGVTGEEWDFSLGFVETQDFPRTLVTGLEDTRHVMTITLASEGELTLGGVEVTREAPFVWPIILMTVGSLICLFFALRSIAFLFATRAGHLRRKSGPDYGPQLPQMPNWRPERRFR